MTTVAEMPRYQSHKKVWALKIEKIVSRAVPIGSDEAALIYPVDAGYAPIPVTSQYLSKHEPEPGGYYVVYDDGYKSYSPAEPFEAGYTRIP